MTPSIPTGENLGETIIDIGAPFSHDREAAPPAAKPEEKPAAEDPDIKTLREENARLRRTAAEAEENAKFWAKQGRGNVKDDTDGEDEPKPRRKAEPPVEEDPNVFLDDLSKEGLKALVKRGAITEDRLMELLDERDARLQSAYNEDKQGDAFDQRLQSDFPEFMEDNERVGRGQAPKSEGWNIASRHFRELCDAGGVKADSKAARPLMLAAFKMAKTEVEAQGRRVNTDEEGRRERIDNQRSAGGRGRGGGADESASGGRRSALTPVQQQVVNNLKRYGASEESFGRYADAGKKSVPHGR